MKGCISAISDDLDAQIDPRFGRCKYFIIVDTETMNYEVIPNASIEATSGAGIQAAQTIANKGAKTVITGSVGPNAYQVLSTAGINIITVASGTVREAVELFKSGRLRETVTGPTAPMGTGTNPGMGIGMGRGMNRGMGRGMGMGRGRGREISPTPPYATQPPSTVSPTLTTPLSKDQEIQMLENQMKSLQQQLEYVKKRMEEKKEE